MELGPIRKHHFGFPGGKLALGFGGGIPTMADNPRKIDFLRDSSLFLGLRPGFFRLVGAGQDGYCPRFFFFLAVAAFDRCQREPSFFRSTAAGVFTGLAFNAKFYCLVLLPVFIILEFLFYYGKENLLFLKERRLEIRDRWIHGTGSFFLTTFLVFLPATILWPDHHQPFRYVIDKFKEDLAFAQNPFPVFFLGDSGLESHWYYLPIAFFLKEPLPFLLFLIAGLGLALAGKIQIPRWQWVTPLVFFLALLPSLNLGIRYLLPAFPFLFLIAGEAVIWAWKAAPRKAGRAAVVLLALWQTGSVVWSDPQMVGYFNELVPADKKIHYLGDSNLDWGQDQKRLAEAAKQRGWSKVHLAYFGGIDPGFYGLHWQPWMESDLEGPQPGTVYVINAGFLQLAPVAYPPTRPIATSWIADRTPTGKVGDSWYYFEIPGKPVERTDDHMLASVPFLQYRGYSPYTPVTNAGSIR